MKNKYDLLTTIVKLCDENEFLKRENARLQQTLKAEPGKMDVLERSEIEEKLILEGLKNIISYHSLFEYPDIFNDDTRNFIPFDEWVKQVRIDSYQVRYLPSYILDSLGNKQILVLFRPYLKYKYEDIKKDKQVELMEEGKKNKEEGEE